MRPKRRVYARSSTRASKALRKGPLFLLSSKAIVKPKKDVQNSGLKWVIGRNGIYVEPNIEYIDEYRKRGEIANCAADGLCGYTTRSELAFAYARMLTQPQHDGRIYNLSGEPITQTDLANYLNLAFGTNLQYRAMTVADYRQDRVEELGVSLEM